MAVLPSELRNKLERVVVEARDVAEEGARAALEALAVHNHEPYPHMKATQRELRNKLRARARQLGDRQDKSGRLAIDHLAGECAYEHWHRMLFARFLAENNLLIEPQENMAISLAEAEELAKDEGVDVWVFASRCAERMLPQIFRPEDALLQVALATEHMLQLEALLASLPPAVFAASDALGWVYQFWQSKRKDEVNRSEVKIGADELPAVTQLFTEPYMVNFLIHNTLGAWWAGKKLSPKDAECAKTEDELRQKLGLPGVDWEYLRFVRGPDGNGGPWNPAAGTFEGWPEKAAELKVLDPCCGSGHFLVAALHHLVPIRMAEEGLSAREAVDAILRDNLHGLEIDERCCQIAAFALAFAAWTYPDLPSSLAGARGVGSESALGYRELPELHIACTGIGPQATEEQWVKLAEQSGIPMPPLGREPIKDGLRNLHRLFSQAPTLGSLINPAELPADLIAADYETIKPYLAAILIVEKADDETRERAIAAAGMVKAGDLLAGEYTLVMTNVPYLGRGRQADEMKSFCDGSYPASLKDLATVLVERALCFAGKECAVAVVTPHNWLSLKSYESLRRKVLTGTTLSLAARLGPRAFEMISGEVVNVALLVIKQADPGRQHTVMTTVDVDKGADAHAKATGLRDAPLLQSKQLDALLNPDARVLFSSFDHRMGRLGEICEVLQGSSTGDDPKFLRAFWELPYIGEQWKGILSAPDTGLASGRENVWRWPHDDCELAHFPQARIRGKAAWGHRGFVVAGSARITASVYWGEFYNKLLVSLIPKMPGLEKSLWAYLSSEAFVQSVRSLDTKNLVSPGAFANAPFDLAHWKEVAAEGTSDHLPEPESDDPTQWLFHGHPYEADEDAMLQVAVARLLGYRWPAELDDKMRLSKRARTVAKKCEALAKFADSDGIVCIPAVRGEEPAAERLLRLLDACDIETGVDLDDWLRNGFSEEHCKLFHDRPFVWHIWDGRKRDGFHALVNYHKLAEEKGKGRKLLESLTYSYLGEWITRQKDGVRRGEGGAEDRLAAALELQKRLEAILEGEPPFDIFVRWKPLAEQPIGWEPDINDGVRVNIRPFLADDLPNGRTGAGILRWKPNIKWTKDRGKEPERPKDEYPWFWGWDEETVDFMGKGREPDGNRWNDCHYTNKVKQAAQAAGKARS